LSNKNNDIRIIPEEELEEVNERVKKHKRKVHIRNACIVLVLLLLLGGSYLLVHYSTYTRVRTISLYNNEHTDESAYAQFLNGVLEYSKDGVVFLNKKAKEVWNQPYEMKNPIITLGKESAAIGDKGGNKILVLDKDGLKGEIKTTAPVEKITVSDQGIVCAVLTNDNSPEIICYDSVGNPLVEHKASLKKTGYPVDATISPNGKTLLISYLNVEEKKLVTTVRYYSFRGEGEKDVEKGVSQAERVYEDTVVPSVFFMKGDVSVHVGDNQMSMIKGVKSLKEEKTITFKEQIYSVVNNENYVGLILKSKSGYELQLYDRTGKKILEKSIDEEYTNIKLVGNQVIMYDGVKCAIIMKDGVVKFEGNTEQQIYEIFPVLGINKYIIVRDQGLELTRLVK